MKRLRQNGVILSFAVMSFGLASCSSTPEPQPEPQAPPRAQTPVPRPSAPRPPQQTPVAPPAYKPMADDQCGAAALQYLVGKPRTEIPVPLDPGSRRVVCSSCIVTQEYRADRQTIVFSSETGIIQSVKCG